MDERNTLKVGKQKSVAIYRDERPAHLTDLIGRLRELKRKDDQGRPVITYRAPWMNWLKPYKKPGVYRGPTDTPRKAQAYLQNQITKAGLDMYVGWGDGGGWVVKAQDTHRVLVVPGEHSALSGVKTSHLPASHVTLLPKFRIALERCRLANEVLVVLEVRGGHLNICSAPDSEEMQAWEYRVSSDVKGDPITLILNIKYLLDGCRSWPLRMYYSRPDDHVVLTPGVIPGLEDWRYLIMPCDPGKDFKERMQEVRDWWDECGRKE